MYGIKIFLRNTFCHIKDEAKTAHFSRITTFMFCYPYGIINMADCHGRVPQPLFQALWLLSLALILLRVRREMSRDFPRRAASRSSSGLARHPRNSISRRKKKSEQLGTRLRVPRAGGNACLTNFKDKAASVKRYDEQRNATSVSLRDHKTRWQNLEKDLSVKSDKQLASLLDNYIANKDRRFSYF